MRYLTMFISFSFDKTRRFSDQKRAESLTSEPFNPAGPPHSLEDGGGNL